ncbi:MAG TPA: hypothetical protein VF128_01915 [Gemmatimonadaceae bacterium]
MNRRWYKVLGAMLLGKRGGVTRRDLRGQLLATAHYHSPSMELGQPLYRRLHVRRQGTGSAGLPSVMGSLCLLLIA